MYGSGSNRPVVRRLLPAAVILAWSLLFPLAGNAQTDDVPRTPEDVWQFLAGLEPGERQEILEREAREEGSLVLYGATGIDRAEFWIGQFNERYPDIEVEFVRLRASELIEKVLLERQTGRVDHDLIITTITYLELLTEGGALAPYEPVHAEHFDERFRYGSPGEWAATVYEIFPHAIVWRSDRVPEAEAPRTFDALAQSEWVGRAGTTTHLEDTLNALMISYGDEEGMERARALAALDNRLYQSHAALADGIAAGEVDVAWGLIAARPLDLQERGASVDWVMSDPLFAEGNTISAATDTRKPYASALFIDVMTDASTLEASDRWQGGRLFGNREGRYQFSIDDYPNLLIFPSLSPDRYAELNQLAEELFIRRQ